MEVHKNEDLDIDIKELLHLLLHNLWIIGIFAFVFAAGIGVISKYLITPMYSSTTKLYVIHRQDDNKTTYSDLQTGAQLANDFMILVQSRPVMEKVIESLGIIMSPGELADMIYVVNPVGTRILEISVVHHDAHLAKELADAIADISSEQMVDIMEIKKINIVEYGNIPSVPTSPQPRKNAMMGGVAGVVLSAIIIIVKYMMNDSIKSAEDIERRLHITTLGTIPLEETTQNKLKKIRKAKLQINKEDKYATG